LNQHNDNRPADLTELAELEEEEEGALAPSSAEQSSSFSEKPKIVMSDCSRKSWHRAAPDTKIGQEKLVGNKTNIAHKNARSLENVAAAQVPNERISVEKKRTAE